MASDSSEAFDGDSDNAKIQSIPDIISYLKYAFRPPDMDAIEKTLLLRDESLKKELMDKNKEYELLEKKYKELRLEYRSKEDELKQYQRNYDDLIEDFKRSEADRKMILGREERTEERNNRLSEKLNQQVERGKKKLHELRSENSELEAAKKKAEAEVEIWMMRFNELEPRVLRLEENIAMLTSEEPLPKKARVAGKVGGTDTGSSETFGEKEWKIQIEKTQENVSASGGVLIQGLQTVARSKTVDKVPVKERKEREIPKCKKKCESPVEKELAFATAEGALIEIIDSDDEETRKTSLVRCTKRKRQGR